MKNKVFGCIIVGEVQCLCNARRLDNDALRNGLAHDVYTRRCTCLCVDLGLDRGNRALGKPDGDENDLGIDSVLGLREEIRCDEGGVACVISDDLNPIE